MNKLTKSQFKKYLECHREFWLAHHHPEAFDRTISPDVAFRIRQGYEVEGKVKELLRSRNDHEYIFQKAVQTERLIARFDVFIDDAGDGGAHIFEIKSSKFIDPEEGKRKNERDTRIYDIGFQVFAARESGLAISKAFLITLNGEYELGDSLDLEMLLKIEDVTADVESIQADIEAKITDAFLLLENEPAPGFEDLCAKKLKCEYFKYTMPDLPDPSIFKIPRLSKAKASMLLESDILDVKEVPDDFELTDNQRDYVEFVKADKIIIEKEEISDWISELEYPLYFLDYETANPSIPQFPGMSPLQQITFQHSLHIKETKDSELIHHEFLSDGEDVPPYEVAKHLASIIGDTGNILVWYKSFEIGRNSEMGKLYPEFAEFFESANKRVVDLMEVFSKKLYRDPAIVGSSLKAVLPVLCPHLGYDDMDIGNGGLAMARWYDDVYAGSDMEKKEDTMNSLRVYCKQDTLAMVEILERLARL